MSISVARERSGRLSRAGEPKQYPPTQIKRMRDAALAGMQDARWGSELGRLFLAGRITAAQYSAGQCWRSLARRYYAAIGAPSPTVPAMTMEPGSHATPADPDSATGAAERDLDRRTLKQMARAHAALLMAGKLAESVTRAVCERDDSVAYYEVDALISGLAALAAHWRLTDANPHGRLSR